MMMQFACTARSADDEDYRPLAETPLTLDAFREREFDRIAAIVREGLDMDAIYAIIRGER